MCQFLSLSAVVRAIFWCKYIDNLLMMSIVVKLCQFLSLSAVVRAIFWCKYIDNLLMMSIVVIRCWDRPSLLKNIFSDERFGFAQQWTCFCSDTFNFGDKYVEYLLMKIYQTLCQFLSSVVGMTQICWEFVYKIVSKIVSIFITFCSGTCDFLMQIYW